MGDAGARSAGAGARSAGAGARSVAAGARSVAAETEATIARVAAGQHGVVTRRQLIETGLTADMIRGRLRSGRLIRLHRGVYLLGTLVGPLRPDRHREMAAVLACGRGAAVSHRSALWLLGLVPVQPGGPVHVVMEHGRCRRAGIVAHRVVSLPETDVGAVEAIPTTRAARTILDVAGDAGRRDLERIVARAERVNLLDLSELKERLEVEHRRPGIHLLRALLHGPTSVALTRSEAEERFLELVRKTGLPEPECNVSIGAREFDFFWSEHGVAVEVDGFEFHASRRSFEGDRARDFALGARGIEVCRVTWRQIVREPFVVIGRLAATLARAELQRALAGRGAELSGTS